MITFIHRSTKPKILTSTPKPMSENFATKDDDVQLALGLSISTELLRRESSGFISTQEYREDERRRTSLLRERESIEVSKDMFETEEEELVVDEEEHEVEVMADTEELDGLLDDEELRCFSQFRQSGPEEKDETRRERWCGDDKLMMPESKSNFVGQRVKPSVVVQASRQSVGDCSLRLMRSFNDGPAASTIKDCQDAKIKIGVLKQIEILQDSLPINLQYLEYRKVDNDRLVVKLSDGVNQKEFLMSERFGFMFIEDKIKNYSILKILKLKKKDGLLMVTNLAVAPMGKKMSLIGEPK